MNGNASLLIAIIVYVAVAATTVAYAVLVRKAKLSDPILQFVFFLSLFVLPLPVRACMTLDVEGDVADHLLELVPYLPEAVFLTTLALAVFAFTYYSRVGTVVGDRLPKVQGGPRWRLAFVLLSALSLFLIIQLATSAGGLMGFLLLGYKATAETVGKGYLAMGFTWLFVASMFLLYGYAIERKKWQLISFILAFGVVVLMHLVLARRGAILYMGLAVWLFWHHAVRPIKTRSLIIPGIICFIGLNVVGVLRNSAYEGFDDLWARTTRSWDSQSNSGLGHAFVYTLTTGEFVVPFETFPQMIESVGSAVSPEFGMTYIRAPLQVIPQALFPGRPLPLANWYMQKFYGGGYDFNEGRAFFFLAEGYLNFGIVGVIMTALLWGIALGGLQRYALVSAESPGSCLLYSLTVAYIGSAISGEAISVVVALPETSLVAAGIGLWITRLGSRKRETVLLGSRLAPQS